MPPLEKLTRTQILMIALAAVVLLWQVGGRVSSALFGPFSEARQRLADLKRKVDDKQFQADSIDFARARLAGWKARSLPPDEPNSVTAKKPDALKAHVKYQDWITDLVILAGFDNPIIRPAPTRAVVKNGNNNVYLGMTVFIEGEATYGQLCTFLDHFYRTNLMHRITKLHVESRESSGDPTMKISIEAEALALADVLPRRTLFTETVLTKPLAASDTTCEVASSDGFPRKPPFRVRMGSEYLTVTAISGKTWTVVRGVERTHAGDYRTDERVEFTPLSPAFPSQDTAAFRKVLAANPFIKPPPPKKYDLKVGPFGDPAFVRGSSFEYTIPASEYDPTLGKPEFTIASGAPPGLRLDRGTGKITWKPADDQPAGLFPMQLDVRHPSAPDGHREAQLTIAFREPNTTPTATVSPAPVAYIGREWKYKLDLADKETLREKLSIKLGDGSPQGLSVKMPDGELVWTPPESLKPGDYSVQVTITDDGTPPQSATVTLPLKLEDDAAQFTKLVGIVGVDKDLRAMLYNQLQDQTTFVRVGDAVKVGDVSGTVSEIKPKYLLLKQGDQMVRLDLSRNLRELEPVATAAVAKPAPEFE